LSLAAHAGAAATGGTTGTLSHHRLPAPRSSPAARTPFG